MVLYNAILKIQEQYNLSTVEFLESSKLSNTLYYDIKAGRKKKLSPKQLKKLKSIFKDFDFSVLDEVVDFDKLNKTDLVKYIYDNWDELMKEDLFNMTFVAKANEYLLNKKEAKEKQQA